MSEKRRAAFVAEILLIFSYYQIIRETQAADLGNRVSGGWSRFLTGPFGRVGRTITSRKQFIRALGKRSERWVIPKPASLKRIFVAPGRQRSQHPVLALEPLEGGIRELLAATFRVVLAPGAGIGPVSVTDFVEILGAMHPESYFIGGSVVPEHDVVVVLRGDLSRLVVPRAWFVPRGTHAPDFSDLEVIDCGQAIRLGRYVAAADAVLYEHDAAARCRMKARVLSQDPSLGAALRRLRLQKRVRREDFGDVSAKTIARIERGEIKTPRQATLACIAKRLRVKPEEIGQY